MKRRRADEAALASRLFPLAGGHSGNDEWGTPPEVFDPLNQEFNFSLDVSAQPYNAKCAAFITPERDGLRQSWPGVVWCNPPYSQVGHWTAKARTEISAGGGHSSW